jgi:hypothetical protein
MGLISKNLVNSYPPLEFCRSDMNYLNREAKNRLRSPNACDLDTGIR